MSATKPAKKKAKKLTVSDLKKVKGGRLAMCEFGSGEYSEMEQLSGKTPGFKSDGAKKNH